MLLRLQSLLRLLANNPLYRASIAQNRFKHIKISNLDHMNWAVLSKWRYGVQQQIGVLKSDETSRVIVNVCFAVNKEHLVIWHWNSTTLYSAWSNPAKAPFLPISHAVQVISKK